MHLGSGQAGRAPTLRAILSPSISALQQQAAWLTKLYVKCSIFCISVCFFENSFIALQKKNMHTHLKTANYTESTEKMKIAQISFSKDNYC
jgi:hypothetical protein